MLLCDQVNQRNSILQPIRFRMAKVALRVSRVFETAAESSFTAIGPQVGFEYHWGGWGLFGEVGGGFGRSDSFFRGGDESGFYPQFAMGVVVAAQ